MADDVPRKLHLIGVGVGHSIAPSMHNHICKALQKPWHFYATEANTVDEALALLRDPDFAGAVITMPYKQTIMPHLDGVDNVAATIGACNNVYITPEGKLRGTNTDWRGVYGCLKAAAPEGSGKPAMIFGAGGASRATVYALAVELHCPSIYVVNRDAQEVEDLIRDTQGVRMDSAGKLISRIIHIQTLEQAKQLPAPFYIVGTVPDLVPQSETEFTAVTIFDCFLAVAEKDQGVFLDMCFKPRVTRKIKLAKSHGWKIVEGTEIIGHQIHEQYRLWVHPTSDAGVIDDGLAADAWTVLRRQAEESSGINFGVDELQLS